ncbi:MAG: HAMP domain-containing histidine kinase [Gorillibacterium sp.]|nr:HAMP domain-containing histidine kinase [Gorillibacterium sp.]
MKLNIRLPLLFSSIVLVLAVIIALYVRLAVIENVIGNIRQGFEAKERTISIQLEKLYPDMPKVIAYMEDIAHKEALHISLYDKDLNELAVLGVISPDRQTVDSWVEIKNAANKPALLIKLTRQIGTRNLLLTDALIQTFLFLLVVMSVIFILLTLYLHWFITKPIQRLNRRLGKIKGAGLPNQLTISRRDEIGELYEHVNRMEERLQQSNQEQINMIAAITHDIKTPLTSINGFIELMLTKATLKEKDKQEYLKLIAKKANHLTELIEVFSSYANEEAQLPAATFQTVAIKGFFENIRVEYEAELAGLDCELTWEHSFRVNDRVSMNEPMLRRVFANLFSNAVRYASVDKLSVHLSGYIKDGQAWFVLEDNGVGVPESDRASLFQRFFTVDLSRQSQEGGTGLGLASCQSIIEQHGGEISAFPSARGGLGIRFTLPLSM